MYLPNFIMYPLILNHELGHANCIESISKRHRRLLCQKCQPCKPKIIIGDYNDCIGKKPTSNINGYDIYFYSEHINKGLTLSPMFEQFSLEDISECAKAGWKREFKCSLIFLIFTLIDFLISLCYLSTYKFNILIILGLVILLLSLLELGNGMVSIYKSSDKKYSNHPEKFDISKIKNDYFSLQ